jgi:hypothetical protein
LTKREAVTFSGHRPDLLYHKRNIWAFETILEHTPITVLRETMDRIVDRYCAHTDTKRVYRFWDLDHWLLFIKFSHGQGITWKTKWAHVQIRY